MLTSSQPHQVTAVRVAIDVGLFNVFASSNGRFLSLKDLALGTHVEEALLSKCPIFSIKWTSLTVASSLGARTCRNGTTRTIRRWKVWSN